MPAKGGKKGRKIGNKKRKPAQIRYTQERRWVKNKLKKTKKLANRLKSAIKIKVDGLFQTILPDKKIDNG